MIKFLKKSASHNNKIAWVNSIRITKYYFNFEVRNNVTNLKLTTHAQSIYRVYGMIWF